MLADNSISGELELLSETKTERERRRSLGIYYTPPEAAKVLARWAIRHPDETVLEPSFGGCAMLSAAVSTFKSLGNSSPSRQLYGYDVDAAAFVHLAQMGIENGENHFKKQDFLRSAPADLRVSAVLANPPFLSYHRLNEKQRRLAEQLRQRYLPHLPKFASLWVHFVLHSLSFLRTDGRMAFVLPTAVDTADYARPLLIFLQSRFCQVELVHVSERLFLQAGADERISLLLLSGYTPAGVVEPAPLRSRHIASISEIVAEDNPEVRLVDRQKGLDVRDIAAAELAALGENVLLDLGSAASVRIGEVVGDIPFFVKSEAEWLQRKVPSKYLVPLLTRSIQARGVYVLRGRSEGEPSMVPLMLLPPRQRQPKAIQLYIAEYTAQAVAANQTFKRRPVWYRCSYTTDADAFIGSISHDYPRVIANDSGISCSNAFYKIIVHDRSELVDWLPILSLTTPFRLSAEILGRVRGSGGIKLEPSDVKKLCIPAKVPVLSKPEFEQLRETICKMLSKGDTDAASQLADAQIYLRSGLIDSRTMTKLRHMRLTLTNRRFSKPIRDV